MTGVFFCYAATFCPCNNLTTWIYMALLFELTSHLSGNTIFHSLAKRAKLDHDRVYESPCIPESQEMRLSLTMFDFIRV